DDKDKDKDGKGGNGDPKDDKDKDKDKDGKGGGAGDPKDDKDKGGGPGIAPPKHDAKKKETIADQKIDVWAHLPAKRRKEMDAFQRERYMAGNKEVMRAYSRNIGESSRRKDGD